MKATASLPPQSGFWPRPSPSAIRKPGSNSSPKPAANHLKNNHVDSGVVSEGSMALSKPLAREREPSLDIEGLTGEVAQRTAVGFLLIDSFERPIYSNAEALRILLYPAKPGDDSSLEPLLGNKIRAMLPQRNGASQPDFHTVFLSGKRHYLCQAFHFGTPSTASAQGNTALVLERIVQRRLDTSAIAQQFALTPREQETTELLMLGLSSKEIASRMSISPNTVKAFLRLIMVKMGVTSRSGVVGKILAHAVGGGPKV